MAAAVAAPPPGCVEGAAAWRFRRGSSLSHACAFLWGGGPGSAKATAWRRVKGSTPQGWSWPCLMELAHSNHKFS